MRRQSRPFVVEVKHRRNPAKKQSIWGNLNIAAVTAETMRDLGQDELAFRGVIDSRAQSTDAVVNDNPPLEYNMPDPQETEPVEAAAEAPTGAQVDEPKKKAPRAKKANAAPKRRFAKASAKPFDTQRAEPARGKRKIYSAKERVQILAQIEKSVERGTSTKAAIAEAGISEQTYYHWKRAVKPVSSPDDLKDLLALEEENKRLKKQLADRLRQENAELRKKLGLN